MLRSHRIFVLIALCSSNLSADVVASGDYWAESIQLFYPSSPGKVTQAICPNSTVLYSRATCTQSPRVLTLLELNRALLRRFGGNANFWENRIIESYAKIQDVDRKLLEIVSTIPPPSTSAQLLEQIHNAEVTLSQDVLQLSQLRDQLVRVSSTLASSPTGDLRRQYELLNKQIVALQLTVDERRENLLQLIQQYAMLFNLHGEEQFSLLMRQRTAIMTSLQESLAKHREQLHWRRAVNHTLAMLSDETFVYEVPAIPEQSPDPYWVLKEYYRIFESALREATFDVDTGGLNLSLNFLVERPVKWVACKIDVYPQECERAEVTLTSGLGYSAVFGKDFKFDATPVYTAIYRQEIAKFLNRSAKGSWTARLSCAGGSMLERQRHDYCILGFTDQLPSWL